MAGYYFLKSNLSLKTPFLQTNYYSIELTDLKVIELTQSIEKHVDSLQLELIA
jgi:hypothetical protein